MATIVKSTIETLMSSVSEKLTKFGWFVAISAVLIIIGLIVGQVTDSAFYGIGEKFSTYVFGLTVTATAVVSFLFVLMTCWNDVDPKVKELYSDYKRGYQFNWFSSGDLTKEEREWNNEVYGHIAKERKEREYATRVKTAERNLRAVQAPDKIGDSI